MDPVYFDKAYYVKPTGGEKAFTVLLSAMEKQNKAGIAKVVLGTKEALVLIRGKDGVMLVNTLYFYDEVMKAPAIKSAKVLEKEVSLAVSLIEEMTEKFRPEAFKDEYNVKLKKAIKSKRLKKPVQIWWKFHLMPFLQFVDLLTTQSSFTS